MPENPDNPDHQTDTREEPADGHSIAELPRLAELPRRALLADPDLPHTHTDPQQAGSSQHNAENPDSPEAVVGPITIAELDGDDDSDGVTIEGLSFRAALQLAKSLNENGHGPITILVIPYDPDPLHPEVI